MKDDWILVVGWFMIVMGSHCGRHHKLSTGELLLDFLIVIIYNNIMMD